MRKYLIFISIGFELIAAVLIGIYAGEIIDKKLQAKGLATALVIFIVLAGWFVHINYLLKKTKEKPSNDNEDLKQ